MYFGGTSVGSVEKIQNAANRAIAEKQKGHQVVVVVSAMGKSTDELVSLAKAISDQPSKRRQRLDGLSVFLQLRGLPHFEFFRLSRRKCLRIFVQ